MKYTREQQAAIAMRGRDILVSAAAGSGKTAVLANRIVDIVADTDDPVDIDRLLVLTFTNLAAGEMRERIGKLLGERLDADPENAHLQKQATLLYNAQITTIDSFCLYILRNHFQAIGLDPGFRVADEGELKLLYQDVMGAMLEDCYERGEPGFLACVEYFTTGNNDRQLEDYISKLYRMAMSFPWPEEWLAERKGDYALSTAAQLDKSPIMQELMTYAQHIIAGAVHEMQKALAICQEADGPYMYGENVEHELQMLLNVATKGDGHYANHIARYETLIFKNLPSKKDDTVAPEKRKQVQEIRNLVKRATAELREDFFSLPPERVLARMADIAPVVATLVDLALDFKHRLDTAKRDKNLVDFSDLEHFALAVLWEKEGRPTAVARELSEHYVAVMCDEYQDSNQVQELLLQSVAGAGNRFMVGDVKQSIYKFRAARPEIFMEKYSKYPALAGLGSVAEGAASGSAGGCRIDLRQNFRSRIDIIDSINYLFSRIMQKDLGGVAYDDKAALCTGADFPAGAGDCRTELLLYDTAADSGSEEDDSRESVDRRGDRTAPGSYPDDEKDNVIEAEARMIARRIKELAGGPGAFAYRDIVILLRTVRGWEDTFKRVLAEEGVPAVTAARTGYFAANEIQTIMQLASVLDNPRQDIPLFGVMKSFFGGFDEEEIAVIKAQGREGQGLYGQLRGFAGRAAEDGRPYGTTESGRPEEATEDGPLAAKIGGFLAFLEKYRQKAIYTPIAELLGELIVGSGYYHHVAASPDGEVRLANLEMLMKKAAAFAKTSYYGLFHFVRYIEKLEKYEVDYGEANVLGEDADVVRLLSIHKSKGLEFPVCFVAGLGKKFNFRDSYGALSLDAGLGLGVEHIDPKRRVRRKTLSQNVVSQKLKLESLGEELRILYVAMTRAKEKLILTGAVRKMPTPRPDMSFLRLAKAGSFLDFVLPPVLDTAAADLFALRTVTVSDLDIGTAQAMVKQSDRYEALREALHTHMSSPQEGLYSYQEKVTAMSEKFAKPYSSANLAKLYAKTTVSELKKAASIVRASDEDETADVFNKALFEEPEIIPYIPGFVGKEAVAAGSGAVRGLAYHRLLEIIRFGELQTPGMAGVDLAGVDLAAQLAAQIDDHISQGRLLPEERDNINLDRIIALFSSPIAIRMIAADRLGQLRKEQPFVIGISADRLDPGFPAEEAILIQGIIDAFFAEEDGLVIVDYKTDAVENGSELVKRYQKQLDYYQEALEQLTGKRVKEKVIYSFALGEVVAMP